MPGPPFPLPDPDEENPTPVPLPSFMTTHALRQIPLPGTSRDALLSGICRRCGFIAKHATPQDCIDFLRDYIAELSPKAKAKKV
jgi:hypothetical protein